MVDFYEENDSFGAASNLGALTGINTYTNLDIDSSGDDDWFSFTFLGTGQGDSGVRINFDDDLGDVDLQIYDASNTLISTSQSITDEEFISLANFAAGTYYARIYGYSGATNPDYSLTVIAPIVDDVYEENDSLAQAYDLGGISGDISLTNLIVRDADWFEFSLASSGQPGDQLQVDFLHALGDVDVAIYDSAGTYLDGSFSVTNNETVSLAGLGAGTYYAEVYGFSGSENSYSLSLSINIGDDVYEENDSLGQSTNLGQVTGVSTLDDLAILDNDWFRFDLLTPGRVGNLVRIDFQHRFGDVDLALYDSSGNFLDDSTSVTDSEEISLAGRSAGTYYVEVYGWAGANNPYYELTIDAPTLGDDRYEDNDILNTATPLGSIAGQLQVDDLVIVANDPDWFSFSLIQAGRPGDGLELLFDDDLGDIDVQLFDSAGNYITGSFGVTDEEFISFDGFATGTYYAEVYGFAGANNPNYRLTLQSGSPLIDDLFEDNDTRTTASDLREVEGLIQFDNLVVVSNDDDWFRFELLAPGTATSNVSAEFSHSLGDIDLALYDANGTLLDTSISVTDNEYISLASLPAGVYYARVYGYAGASNPIYDLEVNGPVVTSLPDAYEPNDTVNDAIALRESGTIPDLSIHAPNNDDWFEFSLLSDGQSGDEVFIEFSHTLGDIDMELYAYNELGNLTELRYSNSISDSETIGLNGLTTGDYFLRIYGYAGDTNPYYNLTLDATVDAIAPITPDFAEANDSRPSAYDLGTIRGDTVIENLNIHAPNNEDWYQFTTALSGAIEVQVDFEDDWGDLDLVFYDANGTLLDGSYSVSDREIVSFNGAASNYFVQIYGYAGATNPAYTLTVHTPTNPTPDAYEVNNTLNTASEIRDLNSVLPDLSIHDATDQDWFEFTMTATGTASNQVFIEFEHDLGNLDLALYNGAGQLLGNSATTGDREQISLDGLAADTYYTRILGANGATNPDYSLTLNATPPSTGTQDDWTILVYIAADNNLEGAGLDDINEMESVLLPDNVNVVVQIDRLPGYDASNDNWTDTRRGLVQHDSNMSLVSSNLTSIGEQNMGNPSTLTNFMNWGTQNFSAENYALVIWDHGGGLTGAAWDDTSNSDRLTTSEITQAIQNAGVNNLSLIGFDACLMAMIEQGYELRSLADVMVAAQQTEPFDGWDYQGFLQRVVQNPQMTAEQMGAAIVDSYEAFYQNAETLSATRLSDYGGLATAIDTFANTVLTTASAQDWQAISSARNATPFHDDYARNDRDLGEFMLQVASRVTTTAIANAANAVSAILTPAVINQVNGLGFTGLGITLPGSGGSLGDAAGSQFLANTRWDDFLNALISRQATSQSRSFTARDYAETNDIAGNVVRDNNDTRNQAFNMEQRSGANHRFERLNVHRPGDRDWFRFETLATGMANDRVAIEFMHAEGDLNLDLYDASGTLLGSSATTTNNEAISLNGLATGEYFVRVTGANDTVTNPGYSLELDAPATPAIAGDWAERNDTFEQAFALGITNINQGQTFSGLTMSSEGQDVFTVGAVRGTDFSINTVSIEHNNNEGNLDLIIYDQDRNLIGSSETNRNIESVSFDMDHAGLYIEVLGRNGATNPNYVLRLNRILSDIDGNREVDALSDGLLCEAYVGGRDADELTAYVGTDANRTGGEELADYLEDAETNLLDLDGNGLANEADAQIFLGITLGAPDAQIEALIGNGATRTTIEEIYDFFANHQPSFQSDISG